jgi:diaminopimelate epimerase
LRKILFSKYHGTGNDFIIIDNREQKVEFKNPAEVSQLCHRHFGIGADGLILLENSTHATFRMVYYNSDGWEGSMCGNGGRCLAAFAHKLGLAGPLAVFEASDGLHQALIPEDGDSESLISLRMKDVSGIVKETNCYLMDTGSPHCVVITPDAASVDVILEGRKVRYNDRFRERGINVNFISFRDNVTVIRTYERGVENETWSCGTGSVAAALASVLEGKNAEPGFVDLEAKGGKLRVRFQRQHDTFIDIWLEGLVAHVYDGEITI